jgi:hypothetical protein
VLINFRVLLGSAIWQLFKLGTAAAAAAVVHFEYQCMKTSHAFHQSLNDQAIWPMKLTFGFVKCLESPMVDQVREEQDFQILLKVVEGP